MARRTRTVFLKELRETMRDKRVLLGVIVSPLLVTPGLILAASGLAVQKARQMQAEVLHVGIVGGSTLAGLDDALSGVDSLTVDPVPDRDAAVDAVTGGRMRAVLVIPDGTQAILDAGGRVTVEILFDGASEKSQNARDRLRGLVQHVSESVVVGRLQARGLEQAAIKPFDIEQRNLAPPKKTGGFVLGMFLPYIVILGAAFGGMSTAFDLCAGEKERGTMETLLVSPASRHEIIMAKLGTITVVSVLSAFCSIAGLVLAVKVAMAAAGPVLGEKLDVSYAAVGAMLLIIVPVALMTSGLLLIVSTFARNPKEAQAFVFPFMVLILLPAISSMILGAESSLGLSLVPILNTALSMKQVLTGVFNLPFLGLALASSAVYAVLIMRLAVAMFERESILFRT